jgi:hypothetical protein
MSSYSRRPAAHETVGSASVRPRWHQRGLDGRSQPPGSGENVSRISTTSLHGVELTKVERRPPRKRQDWIERAIVRHTLRKAQETGEAPSDEEMSQKLTRIADLLKGEMSDNLRDILIEMTPAMAEDHRRVRGAVEEVQTEIWGPAFDLIEAIVVASAELGQRIHLADIRKAARENDLVFESNTRLHARAIRIANEILVLMRAGYATGAMARVRALQENVFVALFIRQEGQETAERFLLHQDASRYASAVELNRLASRLNEEPIPADEVAEMEENRDQLRAQFDQPCYDGDYGWALTALKRPCSSAWHAANPKRKQCRVTFAQIEKAVDMEQYRPYYRLAGYGIHTSSKSLYWDLGLDWDDEAIILFGPSMGGFTEPASITAHLVALSMIDFIQTQPGVGERVWMSFAILKLVAVVHERLEAADQIVNERVEEYLAATRRREAAATKRRVPRKLRTTR